VSDERNRLVACRTCGNRVPSDARRCPACGTRERQADRAARPPGWRPRRGHVIAFALVLALAPLGIAAIHVTTPFVAPPLPRQVDVPRTVDAAPAGESPAAPSSAPPVIVSRSRGRTDWVFFFGPGDWLTRMADDALLGVVVRVEKTHAFVDGSRGPAYVVQSMEGEERVIDADELERSARLR